MLSCWPAEPKTRGEASRTTSQGHVHDGRIGESETMRARDMIRARAKREPAFRDALYQECQHALRDGKPDVAEHILSEYLELPETAVREAMAGLVAEVG